MSLMLTDFHFTEHEAWNRLPLIRAFAYEVAWLQRQPYLEMAGGGYTFQHGNTLSLLKAAQKRRPKT